MPRGKTTTVTVSPDGCTITLRHRIYFHDADLFNPNFQAQVDDAKRRIAATWQPVGGFTCGQCKILFEFEFLSTSDGAVRDDVDGKHIFGTRGVSHQSGLGPDRRPGCWFGNTPQMPEAAHEVGHELGMTDKYRFVHVDPLAPNDPSKWVEVPDPRGVGRGSQPNLPPDVRCVPRGTYPDTGIAFRVDGTPLEADLNEILLANGVECKCQKTATRTEAPAQRPSGKRNATAKTGAPGAAHAPPGGGTRVLPPWTETDVPTPADGDEEEEEDDSTPPREPVPYGEELERKTVDVTPLVFVPGLMGSTLAAQGNTVWPPDRRNFVRQIQAMRDATVPKTATGLTPGVYEPLLKFIERAKAKKGLERSRPESYEIFPYDWTGSCRTAGRALKAFIEEYLKNLNAQRKAQGKPPVDKVDVIAHSFGGLVTRIAKRMGAPIDKQVFMGTPHQGAPKSYFTLHPEVSFADSLGVINDVFVKVLLWWNKDQLPDVPTREELLWRIALATESAWELLPDARHITAAPPLSVDGVNTNFWQHAYLGDPLNGAWAFAPVFDATIADAMALKDALGASPAPRFQNVVASKHKTPRSIDFDETRALFLAVVSDRPGDATVTENSATAGGNQVTVKSKHADIPSDKATHEAIRSFIG